MPFLYEGRQHKRTGRESLDSALALQELANMGIANLITFDAHDPSIQNSSPSFPCIFSPRNSWATMGFFPSTIVEKFRRL